MSKLARDLLRPRLNSRTLADSLIRNRLWMRSLAGYTRSRALVVEAIDGGHPVEVRFIDNN
jgi:hypothetical protein